MPQTILTLLTATLPNKSSHPLLSVTERLTRIPRTQLPGASFKLVLKTMLILPLSATPPKSFTQVFRPMMTMFFFKGSSTFFVLVWKYLYSVLRDQGSAPSFPMPPPRHAAAIRLQRIVSFAIGLGLVQFEKKTELPSCVATLTHFLHIFLDCEKSTGVQRHVNGS
jgi:hypothetical protein